MALKQMKVGRVPRMEMTRRLIQHEFLRLLTIEGFTFRDGDDEPHGIQRRVMEEVLKQKL